MYIIIIVGLVQQFTRSIVVNIGGRILIWSRISVHTEFYGLGEYCFWFTVLCVRVLPGKNLIWPQPGIWYSLCKLWRVRHRRRGWGHAEGEFDCGWVGGVVRLSNRVGTRFDGVEHSVHELRRGLWNLISHPYCLVMSTPPHICITKGRWPGIADRLIRQLPG